MIVDDSCRSSAVSTPVTSTGESWSPHGARGRHADVGEDDIGPVRLDGVEQRVQVVAHCDERQLRLALDQQPHALTDEVAVLGEHHADRHRG